MTRVIHEAYAAGTSGEPGPVFVEIPVDLQLMPGDAGEPPAFRPAPAAGSRAAADDIARAAALLRAAKRPAIFCGWGAVDATAELIANAELLGAPVSTTLQGLSAFPGNHRLHAGFALGRAPVPAVENAFSGCDALLAAGTRFAEIPTGSYGWEPPADLVHVDINPQVFGANYPAAVALEGDARVTLAALRDALGGTAMRARADAVAAAIARDKAAYREEWLAHDAKGRVNPQRFFSALRARPGRRHRGSRTTATTRSWSPSSCRSTRRAATFPHPTSIRWVTAFPRRSAPSSPGRSVQWSASSATARRA